MVVIFSTFESTEDADEAHRDRSISDPMRKLSTVKMSLLIRHKAAVETYEMGIE
jgi:hypothetical protein